MATQIISEVRKTKSRIFLKTQRPAFLRSLAALLLVALLVLALSDGTKTSAQVVTSTADSGPGTLRSAITNAANGAVITFAPNLSGQTITLASTLTINTNLTIDASALTGGIQINGNGAVQIINVASGSTVVLNSLTITNGNAFNGAGGGVYNGGTLTVNECTLSGNIAELDGGGIFNVGLLTVNECTLSGNTGNGEYGGGGIINYGTLAVNESTLSGNSAYNGGGIFNNGTLTVNECTLSGNSAGNYYGGGIYNGGTLTLFNSIGAGNGGAEGADIFNAGYESFPSEIYYQGSNIVQSIENNSAYSTITGPAPINAAPNLAPLDNYGGPTQTMPPLFGSPAIGAGSVADNTFATDQRGYPRTQNGLIDIGAVEFAPVSPVVTNLADAGAGSLRQAIVLSTNGTTITFTPNLSGATITLASTLTINTNLTIDASALPGGIQINGNGSVQIFNVASGTTDVLNSLIIINGNSYGSSGNPYYGGGIYNDGTLTVKQCALSGNYAGIYGGGICNDGTVTVNECTLSENSASGGGGGIYNDGTVTVNECTLSENSTPSYGGGICNDGTVTVTVNECTLSENSAGYGGGGICSDGTITVNECTLSGNSAEDGGGGIFNFGTLTNFNTIVAGNSAGSSADIYNYDASSLTYSGSNLVQSVVNSGTITGSTPATNDPDLAPLDNYGGPTQTMPPLPGSPAIGAGSVAGNIFTTDQRGYPRTQDGLIDIGAVELPTIQFTASPTNDWMPNPVQFSSPVADSDGSTIIGRIWNFGDGGISTARTHTRTYTTPGTFTPTLIVTNSLDLTLAASGPTIGVYRTLRFQSFTRTNGSYQFSWNTVSNRPAAVYQLQYTTNLLSTNWINLGGVLAGIDPALTIADTSPTNRQRFYRLAASMGENIFQDTFDPTTGTGIGISYDGGDLLNPTVGVVPGVGISGLPALQIQCSATNGPNGYTYLAGQWQDPNVSGNTDTNLGDYYLSFDAYVTGDALHQAGGGFALQLQEGAGTNFSTTFPQGQLQTYQAYQGGSDLLVPQSGVWKHFTINLGGSQFQSPNGTNITFNPTGGTWQLIFQLNSVDWGGEPQTNSTLIIDNIALTDLTP